MKNYCRAAVNKARPAHPPIQKIASDKRERTLPRKGCVSVCECVFVCAAKGCRCTPTAYELHCG